jgi:hypothetical protein
LQITLFINLLTHIKRNSLHFYYQNILSSFNLYEINDLGNLIQKFPVIVKTVIRLNKNQWIYESLAHAKLFISGSSGHPFEIYHSKLSYETKAASKE